MKRRPVPMDIGAGKPIKTTGFSEKARRAERRVAVPMNKEGRFSDGFEMVRTPAPKEGE